MLQLTNTIDPHSGEKIIYAGASWEQADSAMIMLHGRGANAESMQSLIMEFKTDGMMYIIPQATGYSWYPYRFIETRAVNEPGISSGLRLIDSIIVALGKNNLPGENIFLLGFSQGACLAADYAARYPIRLGGVFALSGGLIGDKLNPAEYKGDLQKTPVFLGCSESDFHIPAERVHESSRIFNDLNADVTKRLYPEPGHTINQEELDFINQAICSKQFAV